jgi:arylsulfatase A-like enzyme
VSHHYWKYLPQKDIEDSQYRHVIRDYYILIDAILGKLTSILPDDWTIMIVSDHGFKACTEYENYVVSVDTLLRLLDLDKKVFATRLMEKVFLRPNSTEVTLKHIGNLISNVICEDGEPLYRVIYAKDYVEIWPNIIGVKRISAIMENQVVYLPNHQEYPLKQLVYSSSSRRSGTHDENGVILATGPNIVSHKVLENASIFDIAPTLLALKNMPIPKDMDGRVLTEVFIDKNVTKELEFIDTYEEEAGRLHTPELPTKLPDDEEQNIKNRLRELGYL